MIIKISLQLHILCFDVVESTPTFPPGRSSVWTFIRKAGVRKAGVDVLAGIRLDKVPAGVDVLADGRGHRDSRQIFLFSKKNQLKERINLFLLLQIQIRNQ